MKRLSLIVLLTLACAPALAEEAKAPAPGAPTATAAPSDQEAVATIGGTSVTRGEFKEYLLVALGVEAPQIIDNVLQTMINERLVRGLAKKMGISIAKADEKAWIEERLVDIKSSPNEAYRNADQEQFRRQYEPFANFGCILEKVLQARRVTDEGLRHEFDVRYGEKRQARHILFQTQQEPDGKPSAATVAAAKKRADDTYEDLKHGADFGELAKKLSEDPGSRPSGGELPEFGREDMVPEFSEIAFKLKEKEISPPVRSQFGWHIIQVTKIVAPAKEWNDALKAELKAEATKRPIESQEAERLFKELSDEAKVEKLLGPKPKKG